MRKNLDEANSPATANEYIVKMVIPLGDHVVRSLDLVTLGNDGKLLDEDMSLFNWAVAAKTVQVQMEK